MKTFEQIWEVDGEKWPEGKSILTQIVRHCLQRSLRGYKLTQQNPIHDTPQTTLVTTFPVPDVMDEAAGKLVPIELMIPKAKQDIYEEVAVDVLRSYNEDVESYIRLVKEEGSTPNTPDFCAFLLAIEVNYRDAGGQELWQRLAIAFGIADLWGLAEG
jgi:hypothetical protein